MNALGIEIPSESKVFFDTSAFIYFIEEKEPYFKSLKILFEANKTGDFQIVTSPLTLTEVLVLPLRQKKGHLVNEHKDIITNSPFVFLQSIDVGTAVVAAKIRATYNLQTPDALQIACAITSGATFFLTNDRQLSVVKEIKIVQLTGHV